MGVAGLQNTINEGHFVNRTKDLEQPEQIRQSRSDPRIFLFYRGEEAKRWVCAVAKHDAEQAFLITVYPTDAIKEGTQIWPK